MVGFADQRHFIPTILGDVFQPERIVGRIYLR
jgi:hypothetical protein